MLNVKRIITGSNVVWRGKLKKIDRERMPQKTWWDCVKNDMESFGLLQKDAQFRNEWRKN